MPRKPHRMYPYHLVADLLRHRADSDHRCTTVPARRQGTDYCYYRYYCCTVVGDRVVDRSSYNQMRRDTMSRSRWGSLFYTQQCKYFSAQYSDYHLQARSAVEDYRWLCVLRSVRCAYIHYLHRPQFLRSICFSAEGVATYDHVMVF